MQTAPLPLNEDKRLEELRELSLLDTIEEREYDAITKLAATICSTPISLISLIDRKRQWFKSHYGLKTRETPRDLAFCAHAILQNDLFIVEDATQDQRFFDNPLVVEGPKVIFYAGVPLTSNSGHNLGTLCIIDHKPRTLNTQQSENLRLLANQVVELFELRRANMRLKHIASSRSRFLSIINHEMRNPLNIVMGYLDLMNEDAKTRKDQASMDACMHAHAASEQILAMLRDIIDHTSLEAGELRYRPQTVEVNSIIREGALSCIPLAQPRGIEIKFQPYEPTYVQADPQRLRQITINLVSNACKYATAESEIIVEVKRETPQYLSVRFTNIGPTISHEDQGHIFEQYYRSKSVELSCTAGFGLGLSIARNLAELQGGEVLLESSVNEMTIFLLKIKG